MATEEAQLEETVEESLRRTRRSLRHHRSTASATINAGGPKSQIDEEEEEDKEEFDLNDYSDEVVNGASHTNGHSGIRDGNIDHSSSQTTSQDEKSDNALNGFGIQKSPSDDATSYAEEIVNEEITPSSNVLSHDNAERQTDAYVIEGSDREVVELDLEKFLEDPEAYDILCPNCNCCIKKVILRRRKQERSPQQDAEPVDVFRCTSCFSFLILAGRRFVSLFVPEQREHAVNGVHIPPSSVDSVGDGPVNYESSGTQVSKKDTIAAAILGPNKPVHGTLDDLEGKDTDVHAVLADQSPLDSSIKSSELPVLPHDDTLAVNVPIESLVREKDAAALRTDGPGDLKEVSINIRESTEDNTKKTRAGPAEPVILTSVPLVSREEAVLEPQGAEGWDILKSIVYGGLIESVTSLGVVTSAAGANADTVNILALGLANLITGLFVLGHNLWELKSEGYRRASNQTTEGVDRYQELLGRRENAMLHATTAVLSFLIFGTVPVVTYAFSFRESDARELKLAAALAASLFCIVILAVGKAHAQGPRRLSRYVKTVLYYACTGIVASSVAYVAGNLLMKLMDKLGWFSSSAVVSMSLPHPKLLKQA